ncbi:MAG: conjugal transfer protein TraD [Cyanobacteria bacterium P01_F01_bin.143]
MDNEAEKIRQKLHSLEQKRRQLSDRLAREKARLKERERKQRTRTLIEIGGLAEIAGLTEVDKGALLGGMLEVAHLLQDKTTFEMLKAKGSSLLLERSVNRKRRTRAS